MSKIMHPNIVLFLGACLVKPNLCLVMEYLPGGNLFDYIHAKENNTRRDSKNVSVERVREAISKISEGRESGTDSENSSGRVKSNIKINKVDKQIDHIEAIMFAIDVARGMKYLHDRAKIIQRDLKSKNLLIDGTKKIKICDFGLSKAEDRKSSEKLNDLGTPYWLAPELIRKESCGPKVSSRCAHFNDVLG